MTYDELRQAALEAVGSKAIGWIMTPPSKGGEEVALYDHDAGTVSGHTRASVAAILLRRWPKDAQSAIDALQAEPEERWVVAVSGAIFVWLKVRGTPAAVGEAN